MADTLIMRSHHQSKEDIEPSTATTAAVEMNHRHTVSTTEAKREQQMENQQNTKQNTEIRRQIHFDSSKKLRGIFNKFL